MKNSIKELNKKSQSELIKEVEEKQIALRDIRFNMAGSKSKNVKAYANIKKEIAQMSTVLRSMN